MEALSITKRFRSNENADYVQSKQIHQTIQTIKEKALKNDKILSNMTNTPPKSVESKRLLNRPSTTSHLYGTNQKQSSKTNPSVLYSKLLLNHTKTNDKKIQINPVNNLNLSIINQSSSNLLDPSAKQSSQTLVNASNQSSLNSDVFVDRLSDQRIFNRQFKIQNLTENTGNKSARTNSAKQNYQSVSKTKQQFYTQTKARTSVPNSSYSKTKIEEVNTFTNQINSANRKSNLSNRSNNKIQDYQSSSIYMEYKNRKANNSSSVYYNLASARNPVSFQDDKNQRNSGMTRKFLGFNITDSSQTQNQTQNVIQKSKNQFEDHVFIKSTESFNDIYFSAPSGVFYEQIRPNADKNESRLKSAFIDCRNQSPLPTDSPAIVNLLLNNQNKLYESTKIVDRFDTKRYQQNRVPVRLDDTIKENDEKNEEKFERPKKGSKDQDISLDKCTDDYDPNESAMLAAVYKKCNDWLDKHVIPHRESHSNTSSPSLNEIN